TRAVPNGYGGTGSAGVRITSAGVPTFVNTGNRIGSNPADRDAAGERNVIAGNAGPGVQIDGAASTNNLVAGNYIGTDVTGTHALANTTDGVLIEGGAASNTVGAVGSGNIISGNGANGVRLSGAGTGNVIEANFIGLDATGFHALGNASAGVSVESGANGNVVGRSSGGGAGNVISGNLYAGVVISQASNNVVGANYIGTDVSGRAAVPNDPTGLRADGVDLFDGATSNFIGGAGLGNVISGNGFDGVFLYSSAGAAAAGNYVQ